MVQDNKVSGFAEEVADIQNVTDETEEERREPVSFEITAFGADPSVFDLVRRLGSGRLRAPPFQRAYVWNAREASRFVESLLMGLPCQEFLYSETLGQTRTL
jgi:hypothetical protein